MIIKTITLFPELYVPFKENGPIRKAIEKNILSIEEYDLRKQGKGKHQQVDDTPYGGGAGMILMAQPVIESIKELRTKKSKVIMLTPEGKTFNQAKAKELSLEEELIFVNGYYEGFDNRIKSHIDEEISIGDYIVSRGDIPTITMIDAIARLISGAINKDSLDEESFENNLLEYPQYTSPRDYDGELVPEVLLSGNHKKIADWRLEQSIKKTKENRIDLYNKYREKGD